MLFRSVVVLGNQDTVDGFRLAGVGEAIQVDEDFDETMLEGLSQKLILVDEDAAGILGETMNELRRDNAVQAIPGREYKGVRDLIKDTIGFDVNV